MIKSGNGGKGLLKEGGIKTESGGLDRRTRSYLQMKSMAVRTGGRQSQGASMDGGPAGAEDCARSGPVGSEVRIGVQGATTSLAMTRVKHHSRSWVRVVVRGNGVRRRRWDVVIGAGVGSALGDWCQDCMDMTASLLSTSATLCASVHPVLLCTVITPMS